jgi:hypothetical protein
MKVARACALLIGLSFSLTAPAHANVIVGAPANSSNGFPFINYNGEYQQAYASSNFPGTIPILGLSFVADRTSGNPLGTLNFTGNFTVSLSYSANPVGSLSTTFANNIGADFTTIFSGSVTETNATTFTLLASTPFIYNPTLGPLLLDVVANTSGLGGLTANTSFPGERVFCSNTPSGQCAGGTVLTDTMGLVTEFITPLPAALPLFATGLGGLGLLGWRRKRKARAA